MKTTETHKIEAFNINVGYNAYFQMNKNEKE